MDCLLQQRLGLRQDGVDGKEARQVTLLLLQLLVLPQEFHETLALLEKRFLVIPQLFLAIFKRTPNRMQLFL